MSSLVYLLVCSPPPHIPYISSPNQCLQQNPPVLKCGYRLAQVVLYDGCETVVEVVVVVVVVVAAAAAVMPFPEIDIIIAMMIV